MSAGHLPRTVNQTLAALRPATQRLSAGRSSRRLEIVSGMISFSGGGNSKPHVLQHTLSSFMKSGQIEIAHTYTSQLKPYTISTHTTTQPKIVRWSNFLGRSLRDGPLDDLLRPTSQRLSAGECPLALGAQRLSVARSTRCSLSEIAQRWTRSPGPARACTLDELPWPAGQSLSAGRPPRARRPELVR